jgi:hypothetical protein
MPRDTAALLDRVRKLLALAGSSNVHEAALAASRAQALIEAHRLEGLLAAAARAEAEPIEDGREQPLEMGRRVRKWKQRLATQLAEMNGCVAWTLGRRGDQRLLVAGRAEDRAAVFEVWSWLVRRIEWLSATEGAGERRAWHDAFRVGAAQTIVRRMRAARLEARAALDTTALAVVEPALQARAQATRRFVEQNLRLKPGRSLRLDADGYLRGRRAGADVEL